MRETSRAARIAAVLMLALLFLLVNCLAAAGARAATNGNKQVTVKKLVMSPGKLQLYSGQTGSFTVQAVYSDKTIKDVTSQAAWISSKPAIATVVAGGEVTAVKKGSAKINVSFGGKKASKTVTVKLDKLKSLTADPSLVSINQEETGQVTLTASYLGMGAVDVTNQAVWLSNKPAVASVNKGKITGNAPGSAKITASFEGKKAIVNVMVKEAAVQVPAAITVTPASLALSENGGAETLTANVRDEDNKIMTGGYELDWSTDNASVVIVGDGVVTPVASGTACVTVTVRGTNLSAVCDVTVEQTEQALPEVFDGSPSVGKFLLGNTYALTITGKLKEPVAKVEVTVAGVTYNATIDGASFSCDATAPSAAKSLEIKVTKSDSSCESLTLSM
ncbi:MAG: Bacterial Ig-like domain (group 2) [Pelotomaculum sp. PtaU1.Bin035]|nr:MAG: Bacterial Ig-like domain (group 2) [Pelotomaculum sp. PtaU1.Bin035]